MTNFPTEVAPKRNLALVKQLFQKGELSSFDYPLEIQAVGDRYEAMLQEYHSLLGIEAERRGQLSTQMSALLTRKYELKNRESKESCRDSFFRRGYDTWMPVDPLRWRDPITQMPIFGLFSPHKDHLTISSSREGIPLKFSPDYPDEVKTLYHDLETNLRAYAKTVLPKRWRIFSTLGSHDTVKATAEFVGVMPDATRQKIKGAEASKIFSRIFILTEVPKWEINAIVPINIDPLVLGWDRRLPEIFFYIDSFDITPLENKLPLSME